jgi:hypothetical protein
MREALLGASAYVAHLKALFENEASSGSAGMSAQRWCHLFFSFRVIGADK